MSTAENWLRRTLGYTFDDRALFERSLTHRSAAGRSNERLEFLGDAVLDFVASDVVYRRHPNAPEGDLSRLRSFLVRDASLASLAVELGVGEYLRLGSGEKKTGGHHRRSILADALEALFGAVFVDGGFEAARRVIERAYGDRFVNFPPVDELRDPKTRLQEWLQARHMALPGYNQVSVSGEAHRRRFEIRCTIAGVDIETSGTGRSRRNAEQKAARAMLESLQQRSQ